MQPAQKPQGGRPESGISLAAREHGLPRDEVRRAKAIAGLIPEAQHAAVEVKLAGNKAALLEAAKQPTEEQAAYLRERAGSCRRGS